MNTKLDTRRIIIFLAIAFGLAWASALVIYLNGQLVNSPKIGSLPGLTLATLLMATGMMWAPAVANILTRLITREGFHNTWLRPNLRRGWKFWLAAWFLPGIFTVLGAAFFFLLFPSKFDANLTAVRMSVPPSMLSMNPWVFILIQTVQAMLLAPIFNFIATFGEEFGWRAYLLQKLAPLGMRRALILMGIIWGVWHWPVIFMGYEYGFDYPGHPWLGPLLFIWFTFTSGILLAWATLRGRSVWPAVIGHAAINGIAAIGILLASGKQNLTLGPLPIGIVGSIAFSVFALWVFLSNNQIRRMEEAALTGPAEPVREGPAAVEEAV